MFRFFFDIDGVILNFESAFINAVKSYFKLDIPENYQANNWFFSDILTDNQITEGWEYFIESEHFAQMPSLINSEEFNQVFEDYPIHFITNIPPKCLEKRKENLKLRGFKWNSIFCGGHTSYNDQPPTTKAEIINQLIKKDETVLFVDDHPDNCKDVWENVPNAHIWLMSRRHNLEFMHSEIQRATNWDDILGFSKGLISSSSTLRL